jgi:hypothetical protein
VAADPARGAKYGQALSDIENAYKVNSTYALAGVYYNEAALRGPEIISLANAFKPLADELSMKNPDKEKTGKIVASLREQAKAYFKDYYEPIDVKMLASMMELFHNDVPADQQPLYFTELIGKYSNDYKRLADDVFSKSFLACPDKVNAFLDKPNLKTLTKDPAYALFMAFNDKFAQIQKARGEASSMLARGNRTFIAGLREMNPDRNYAPDANSTMRLTYGTVQGYSPADAVYYDYFTTLEGVMEKEDPTNYEFIVPEKLKQLFEAKDYGPYGQDGLLHTCFLTNHDITGGNSGSPVINAKGQLIGIAFDGNWEAMSGDIAFEPAYQRTISVDIRYVLFMIDKYAGAKNLIDEMTIVKAAPLLEKDVTSVKVPAAAIDSKE